MASKEKDSTKEPELNSVDVKFVFECLKNLDKERVVRPRTRPAYLYPVILSNATNRK